MSKESQAKQVLRYLKEHPEGLTQIEATSMLQITRLAARISDLRQEGYHIYTTKEKHNNGYHARYKMVTRKEQ